MPKEIRRPEGDDLELFAQAIEKVRQLRMVMPLTTDELDRNITATGKKWLCDSLRLMAMREPSEAMLNAARDWSIKKYGQGIGKDGAIGCWQAMFDAALMELNTPATEGGDTEG